MMRGAPGPQDVATGTLANGLEIFMLENHASPAVVVDGVLFNGALAEPVGKEGLAGFMAEMLERGTTTRGFAALSDDLESIGADVSFDAGRHTVGFSVKCLAEDLGHVLELLADMLQSPAFASEQVERVRGQILTDLQQQMDDTRYRAGLRFRQLAYGSDHPYGRDANGTPESIAGITRSDLVAFYEAQLHPAGGHVVVVGDFEPDACRDHFARTVGAWAAGQPPARPTVPAAALHGIRDVVTMPGKIQSDVMLGNPSLSRAHPDWLPASVANAVLGVFGMMGRLGDNVRDRRGLAYYAYSRVSGGLGPGPWYATAGVNPSNIDEAIDAVLEEMRRLRDELVPEEELADVRAFMMGSLPVRLETNEGLASALSDMALYGLGLDYLQRYPELVAAVDAAAVRRAAEAHLHPEAATIVVAGP